MNRVWENKSLILWFTTFIIANGNHSSMHLIRNIVKKQKCDNNNDFTKQAEIAINFIKWFAPKNESIWEHVKMGYFPLLVLTSIFQKDADYNSRVAGLWVHLVFMFVTYYAFVYYIFGADKLLVNIPLYFGCCAAGYLSENQFKKIKIRGKAFKDIKEIKYTTYALHGIIVLLSYFDHAKTVNNDPGVFKFPWYIPDKPNIICDLFENKNVNSRFLYVNCPDNPKEGYICEGKYMRDPKRKPKYNYKC